MISKIKFIEKKYQIIICLIYITSLFFKAITYKDFDGVKSFSSIEIFLFGFFAFLGGGIFEFLIWLANPLFFVSLISSIKSSNKLSLIFSAISLIISLSFLCWNKIIVSESGRIATIIEYNFGYWIWISAILLLVIYNIVKLSKSFKI